MEDPNTTAAHLRQQMLLLMALDEVEGALCARLRERPAWTGDEALALVELAFAQARQRASSASSSADLAPLPAAAATPSSLEGANIGGGECDEAEQESAQGKRSDVTAEEERDELRRDQRTEEETTMKAASGDDTLAATQQGGQEDGWVKSPRAETSSYRLSLSASHRIKPQRENDVDEEEEDGDHDRQDQTTLSPRRDVDDGGLVDGSGDGGGGGKDDEGEEDLKAASPRAPPAVEDASSSAAEKKSPAAPAPTPAAPLSKPIMSARGPRPAGRAPRPSLSSPWTPEGLVHDLGELGDVDVELLPPASPGLRPLIRVATPPPHKSAFLTRTPSTKLRTAYPFLQVASPRASVQSGSGIGAGVGGSAVWLASAAGVPRPPSDSFAPLMGAPQAASDPSTTAAPRCISSPALIPINLEEMDRKIEQLRASDWALQRPSGTTNRLAEDEAAGGGGGGGSEKREKEKKGGKVRRTLKRRAKGKEAEDVSLPSAAANTKRTTTTKKEKKKRKETAAEEEEGAAETTTTTAKTPTRSISLAFSLDRARPGGRGGDQQAGGEEASADRRQLRRKVTIGDWERVDLKVADRDQGRRLVRTRSAIGLKKEQEIYAKETTSKLGGSHGSSLISPRDWDTAGEGALSTPHCSACAASFSRARRRHRCKACERYLCSGCSSHRAVLPEAGEKAARVCDECYARLAPAASSPRPLGSLSSSSSGARAGSTIQDVARHNNNSTNNTIHRGEGK